MDAVTALLGRAPSVFLTYQGWDRAFHASDMQEIAERGAAHVVTWVPTGYTLQSITSGSHDAYHPGLGGRVRRPGAAGSTCDRCTR